MTHRFGGLILAALLAWPTCARAKGLVPPASPADAAVERFLDGHRYAGLVIIQDWAGLQVRYSERQGGLAGEKIEILEYRVQDRSDLEEASTVYAYDSHRFHLKDVEVQILRGHDVQRFRRKDLRWMEITSRSDGVVLLDGTSLLALVPGILVGDRVRIRYEYDLKGIHGLPCPQLGFHDTPYLQTGYEVRLPEGYTLVWGAQGAASSQERLVHTTGSIDGNTVHSWRLDADEDGGLPTCRDRFPSVRIIPHVQHAGKDQRDDISCGRDWRQTGNAYLKRIEGLFAPSEEMIRQAGEITAGLTDQLEKIDRIYASVQQRCHYLGLYEGAGGLIPVPAAEVFELGFGDCKGLATLLISLLRVAGIAAHPVLVCTPAAGQLAPDIPNLAQFNHFIAWADTGGGGIFLDGTVDFCPAGFVPAVDAASPVLLLRPGAIGLVEIPGAAWDAGDDQQVVEGRLEADGLLHLSLARSMSGNLGLRWRNGLASLDRRRKREVVREALLPGGLAVRGEEPEVLGMDEWRRPLTMQMTATSSRPLPADDHAIYLPRNLIPEKWAFDSDVDCDGQLDLRRRPRRFCTWSIELPAGFVLAAPDSTSLAKDGLQLALRIWQEGRLLKLERVFRFTQDFAEAEQVAAMRQALADAARGEAGHIELRRPAHD